MILRLLFMLFSASVCCAQSMTASEFRQELKGIQGRFSQPNTAISFTRQLLIAGEDTTVDKGVFIRGEGLNYQLRQTGVLIVQNHLGKLVIDSSQRMVVLTIVDSMSTLMNGPDLKDETVARAYLLSKLQDKGTVIYRMDPLTEGLERAELIVPGSPSQPLVMKIYMPPANYVSHTMDDATLEHPVLTVTYHSVKPVKTAAADFTFEKYLKTEAQKFVLLNFPPDYTFYDLRLNPTTN